MNFRALAAWLGWGPPQPEHLRRGAQGERAARAHLKRKGLKYLTANYRSAHGEIDLVFRQGEVLVFVEVKTRSSEDWQRPAAAVDHEKRRKISRTALEYLNELGRPAIKFQFDIVEVLLEDGVVREIRHWPHAFSLSQPFRYVARERLTQQKGSFDVSAE
jgi:putative endonuclease